MGKQDNKTKSETWMRSAREDLETASDLCRLKRYAPACFYAQQSAEKAFKAILIAVDNSVSRTHTLGRLVQETSVFLTLPDDVSAVRRLDLFYLPTRYPDSLPDGSTPADVFTESQAQDAIRSVEGALSFLGRSLTHYHESASSLPTPTGRL